MPFLLADSCKESVLVEKALAHPEWIPGPEEEISATKNQKWEVITL